MNPTEQQQDLQPTAPPVSWLPQHLPISDNEALPAPKLYAHGLTNGFMLVPPAGFEDYIRAHHNEAETAQRVQQLNGEISHLSSVYAAARVKRLELLKELLTKRGEHGAIILATNDLMNQIQFWKEKIARAVRNIGEVIEKAKSDYSLPAAILFFLFALLFIGADYGISLTIVANTLKIGTKANGDTVTYTINAHLFALAMAGLSVVFKAAYDRLVEKPYHEAGNRKRFAWFILLTALFVFGMLVSLGMFREETIASGLLDEATDNTDIGTVAEVAPAAAAAPFQMSGWAKVGIVSSTFLFAIAGAICLGIAMPVIHKCYRVAWNNMRQKFWHQHIFSLNKTLVETEGNRIRCEADITFLEEQITDLQEELGAKETKEEKQALLLLLTDSWLKHRVEKSIAIYHDGYYRGTKLTGKISEDWMYETVLSTYPANGETTTALPGRQKGTLSRTRPFVALRKLISMQFSKQAGKDGNAAFEYYH